MGIDKLFENLNINLDAQEKLIDEINEFEKQKEEVLLDDDDENVSDEDIEKKISSFSDEKLCQIVVCYRYINFSPNLAVRAMEELSARRQAGNSFDFESYIEKSLSELPVLNFNMPDLRTFLLSMVKK